MQKMQVKYNDPWHFLLALFLWLLIYDEQYNSLNKSLFMSYIKI